MIWNRKRANGLIIAEVSIAFMVIFAVAALAIRNLSLYQIPLGYDYQNMWRIQSIPSGKWDTEKDGQSLLQLINAVKQMPEVETLNLLSNPTFRNWKSTYAHQDDDGNVLFYYRNHFDDSAAENFNMHLLEGRWFGPEDDNQNYDPVIVNQEFVDLYYPNEDIIGKNIQENEADEDTQGSGNGIDNTNNAEAPREIRVVGVFKYFRQFGELSPVMPYVIHRINMQALDSNFGIELKLNSNAEDSFEQRLLDMLKNIEPDFNYVLSSWANSRDSQLRQTTLPLTIFAIVATFLILMVAMGLFGVLWQNVTTRTHEIGLRRALGATANNVHLQIIGELLIVALMGIAIAFVLIVQLPMLGVFQELDWVLFWKSFLLSLVFMLVLATICAFYPGKMATRYSPSEALHYE